MTVDRKLARWKFSVCKLCFCLPSIFNLHCVHLFAPICRVRSNKHSVVFVAFADGFGFLTQICCLKKIKQQGRINAYYSSFLVLPPNSYKSNIRLYNCRKYSSASMTERFSCNCIQVCVFVFKVLYFSVESCQMFYKC